MHLLENMLILIVTKIWPTAYQNVFCFDSYASYFLINATIRFSTFHVFNLHFIKIGQHKNISNKGHLQQDFTNYEKLWAVVKQS